MLLKIEIDSDINANLYFQPADATIRGRFDVMRMKLQDAYSKLIQRFPSGIPGQQLWLDEGKALAAIVDPLHFPEHAQTRQAVEEYVRGKMLDVNGRGFTGSAIPPERIDFPGADVQTWAYWMQRAVQAGQARLLEGRFQDSYPDAKRSFNRFPAAPDPRDKQIQGLNGTVQMLTQLLMAKLSPAERKELEKLQAGAA